ncbi:MAG: PAS domain S-box protein [Opitutaceae bacterium]|jgi:PAS domain S-box-containing protein|nr:PAS domain S-box protein [Opitutaceae bacterium]
MSDSLRTLHSAQAHFNFLFENAPIGLSWREVLPGGGYGKTFANRRFCELSGLSADEINDFNNVLKITPPEERAARIELQKKLNAGEGDSFTVEKRYLHPDGRVVWTNLTVMAVRDTSGAITHHLATIEDITSRHDAETRLRNSEARWRTYLQTATDTLYTVTPAGAFKFVSAAVTRHLGYAPEELVGRDCLDIVHPDDRAAFAEYVRGVMDGKIASATIEARFLHKNGEYLWHSTSASAYTDRDGRRAFLGLNQDITVRKKAQDALKVALAQREELERIINRSQTIVVLWRMEPGIPVDYVSKSIRQFGYEPMDLVSRKKLYADIIHPDDRDRVLRETAAHAAAGDHDYTQEYRILRADGAVRWVEDHTVARGGPSAPVALHEGLITDITARREAEQRAREMSERALAQAAEVQRHLSPHVIPDRSKIETAAFSLPSGHIGGDYYDMFPVDDRRWGFVIADVAGKGPAAALIMADCRAALRLSAAGEPSPAAVVRKINRFLHPDMPNGMFISLFYGVLDTTTRRLRHIRAGHEPAILLRAGSTNPELLSPEGLALGFDGGALFDETLAEQETSLNPGDLLALYTDGVTEAANASGEEFGRDRFIATLSRHGGASLRKTIYNITRHLAAYSTLATRTDDRTLLLVRPK